MKSGIVIIARYNEDVNWVNKLTIPYLIYNKGSHIDIEHKNIPNEGREGETYLRYILEHYENLPNYITFCQGNPFAHCDVEGRGVRAHPGYHVDIDFIQAVNEYQIQNEVCALGHWIVIEDLNGFPHAVGYGMVDMMHSLNIPCLVENFTFAAGAQYIVSQSHILNKSKKWWENCYEKYNNNPRSPWIFERIWPVIFNHEEI